MKSLILKSLIYNLLYMVIIYAQNTDDAIRILDNQIGFGGRAMGMGGAYLAIADDYSAVYWNPAGLSQMRKMEFWLGISHVHYGNDIVFQGSNSSTSNSATKFNSIGFVFPLPTYRGSLVFALGYQRIRDFEYANEFIGVSNQRSDRLSFSGVDPDNPDDVYDFWGEDVQKEGFITDEGSINQLSAAGAIDVSPNISAGLALNFWSGSSEYFQEYFHRDIFDNFYIYPGDFDQYTENRTLFSKYSSFNVKFSTLIRLGRLARVGIAMDLPHSFTVEEDYYLDSRLRFDNGDEESFDEADDDESGLFEYKVKMPFRFSGGASFSLGSILVSGSAEYTDWTQVAFKTDELKNLNRFFNTDYRSTLKVRLGGEIGIPFLDSQFRAGVILDPTPLKGKDTDWDRKYLSAGYGVLIDKVFKIDLAYMYGFWKQFTSDDLTPEGTEEDVTYQKVLLTISFRY